MKHWFIICATILLSLQLSFQHVMGQSEASGKDKKGRKSEKRKSESRVKKEVKTLDQSDRVQQQDQDHEASDDLSTFLDRIREEASEFTEEKEYGRVNWTTQYVEARGESVIDTTRFKNYAQARAMAVRGAVVVAQRNLLEIINGVRIHGETTVENLIASNDYIYSRVDGVIKGAVMVGEPREQWGMMIVTLQAPLYQEQGLAWAVYDATKPVELRGDSKQYLKVGEVSTKEAEQLGDIIFNLAGKKFDPSLFPIIVDENNNVLIDLYKIYDPKKGKFPNILQTSREIMEELGLKKGVEVIDILDAYDGKLVVSQEAGKKINWDRVLKTAATIGKALLLLI